MTWNGLDIKKEDVFLHPAGAASCAQQDSVDFTPEKDSPDYKATVIAAKLICKDCVCVNECLDHALSSSACQIGVRGGTTEAERESLRRVRR